jgi:hypothetical protein
MNDCPQGLNSWANPATAAMATIQAVTRDNRPYQRYQIEQYQGPAPQVVPFEHSPQPQVKPPLTQVQYVRWYPLGQV